MALTYKYQDVLSMIKTFPSGAENHFAPLVCNVATNLIWHAYDWRESLTDLPPFYLIPSEQDHRMPPAIVPTDFHSLRKVTLCQYTQGALWKADMTPLKDLSLTHIESPPTAISYEASFAGFRVHPRVPANMGCPEWFIEGTYKKRPAKILNTTLDTVLPFDDMYLNVWIEAFQWAYFKVLGSPTAGQAQVQGGMIYYTGQMANAVAAIEVMANNEGYNDGDGQVSPSAPLVAGRTGLAGNGMGLF